MMLTVESNGVTALLGDAGNERVGIGTTSLVLPFGLSQHQVASFLFSDGTATQIAGLLFNGGSGDRKSDFNH